MALTAWHRWALTAFLAGTALAATGLLAAAPAAAQTPATLRIGLADDPDALDPTLSRT